MHLNHVSVVCNTCQQVLPSAINEPGSFSQTCPQHILVLLPFERKPSTKQLPFTFSLYKHKFQLKTLLTSNLNSRRSSYEIRIVHSKTKVDFHIFIVCYRTPKLLCNTYVVCTYLLVGL